MAVTGITAIGDNCHIFDFFNAIDWQRSIGLIGLITPIRSIGSACPSSRVSSGERGEGGQRAGGRALSTALRRR